MRNLISIQFQFGSLFVVFALVAIDRSTDSRLRLAEIDNTAKKSFVSKRDHSR
jgi:hypothetical protein